MLLKKPEPKKHLKKKEEKRQGRLLRGGYGAVLPLVSSHLHFYLFIYERVSGPGGSLRSADGWLVFGVIFFLIS